MSRARTAASMSNGRGGKGDMFFSKGSLRTAPTQQIVLGGKYMLPRKDGQLGAQGTAGAVMSSAGAQWNPGRGKTAVAVNASTLKEEDEVSDSEVDGEDESSTSDEEGRPTLRREKKQSLRQRETPEEKKLRKAKVGRRVCQHPLVFVVSMVACLSVGRRRIVMWCGPCCLINDTPEMLLIR